LNMEEDLNRRNNSEGSVDPEGNGGDVSVVSVDGEELNEDTQTVKLKQCDDENQRNKELDKVYERSSADVRSSMKSPSSFSVLKSDSSYLEREVTDPKEPMRSPDEPTRCRKNVVRFSQIILIISALVLFVISFHLSRQDITQLVGQSIPQVAIGFGILTLYILGLGIVANRRNWVCGFNVQAACLIFLGLSQIFVISDCLFSEYGIFYETDIYWSRLSDAGKARIMANWECCGWSTSCHNSDVNSIYHEYRHYEESLCQDATNSETRKWMLDVTIIFGTFTLFDLLFVIYIIACQAGWLKHKRQEEVKAGATEKWNMAMRSRSRSFMSFRKSISSISPRRFRQSMVGRRLSRVSMSPKFRKRMSFGRNTTNINIVASESDVTRHMNGFK